MLEGRTFAVTVRVTCRDVEIIQNARFVYQQVGQLERLWQLDQQLRHNVIPGLLSLTQVERLDRLFSRLVSGKAGLLNSTRLF